MALSLSSFKLEDWYVTDVYLHKSLELLNQDALSFTDNIRSETVKLAAKKKNKEEIIIDLAQKLEDNNMPKSTIGDYVVKALDGYPVTANYIRKLIRRRYKISEESSEEELLMHRSQDPNVENNRTEQNSIAVAAGTRQQEGSAPTR